jgi:hypothetical protein
MLFIDLKRESKLYRVAVFNYVHNYEAYVLKVMRIKSPADSTVISQFEFKCAMHGNSYDIRKRVYNDLEVKCDHKDKITMAKLKGA